MGKLWYSNWGPIKFLNGRMVLKEERARAVNSHMDAPCLEHQLEFLKLGQLAFSEMVEFKWDFQVL